MGRFFYRTPIIALPQRSPVSPQRSSVSPNNVQLQPTLNIDPSFKQILISIKVKNHSMMIK